jgi:c-di-GMP-related signal transduction protein
MDNSEQSAQQIINAALQRAANLCEALARRTSIKQGQDRWGRRMLCLCQSHTQVD